MGKIEGRRIRGQMRMRWVDGVIDSMDMSLSKPWETLKDREAWHAAVCDITELDTAKQRTPTKLHVSENSHSYVGMRVLGRFSCVQFFVTPWTVAHQAPLSMGFSRQEHWSGLPCPSPEDLPNPGIKPESPAQQEDSLPSEPPGKP